MAPKTQTTTQHSHSAVSASRRTRAASLALHQRKCIICHHPDREEIEEMFLHWFSPATIHRRFLLKDRYSIYRHAHATGLYQRRRRNFRCALENIIERSDECPISSNGIVRAIKAYASLTDAGEWIEPASRVVYISASDSAVPGLSPVPAHAKVPRTTLPGTTVDGWNCRFGDVRGMVPSSAHAVATSAPIGTAPTVGVASNSAESGVSRTQAQVYSTPRPPVSHTTATDAPVAPNKESTQTTAPAPLPSNRNTARIKYPLTNSKQRSVSNSNRNK